MWLHAPICVFINIQKLIEINTTIQTGLLQRINHIMSDLQQCQILYELSIQ